jgi:hypothetical protein
MTHHDDGHDQLQGVADRLRAERPTLTPLELDALKQRVLARAERPSHTTRRSFAFMRTRAAILATLALGFLLSTGGAGLAVTGFADNQQAADAQYPPPAPPTPPSGGETPTPPTPPTTETPESPGSGVLGEQDESPAPEEQPAPEQQVLPEQHQEQQQPESALQPTRQLEAGADESLPFTGFAALPILLIGIALLSVGLVMRRSTRTG